MDLPFIPDGWVQSALCSPGTAHLFFPISGRGDLAREAIAMCGRCPVRPECLAAALKGEERWGIWGGKNMLDPANRAGGQARPPRRRFKHGTEAGAARHRKAGEPPCDACLTAARESQRQRKARLKGDG